MRVTTTVIIIGMAASSVLATPLKWTCDWPEARSQLFTLYQGETATFEPTFRINRQVATNLAIEAVWYQTNGMGSAWWRLDNATFSPSNDVGAAAYRFFVEARGSGAKIYRANGTLRMMPSPGFTPNEIELPVSRLDFAAVDVSNAPWPGEIAAAVADSAQSLSNNLAAAISGKAEKRGTAYTFAFRDWRFSFVGGPGDEVQQAWLIVIERLGHDDMLLPFARGASYDYRDSRDFRIVVGDDGSVYLWIYNDGDPVLEPEDDAGTPVPQIYGDRYLDVPFAVVAAAEALAPTGMDATPTAGSARPVASGGVAAALEMTPSKISSWDRGALPADVRDKDLAVVADDGGYRWKLGVTSTYATSQESFATEEEANAALSLTLVGASVPTPATVTRFVAAWRYADGPNAGREVLAAKNGTARTSMLHDESVTNEKLAPNAVTNSKIAADAITNGKIRDGVIQKAKLHADLQDEIDSKAAAAALALAAQSATNYTDAAFASATNYAESIVMDEYIEGTWTAATASWTGRSRAYSLRDGHHVRIRLPYAGAANVTLNLTLADGSTTGALPCYFQGSTTRLSTQYGAGSIVGMTYRGGVWRTDGDYDANTNYYDRNKVLYCKAAAAIAANKLVVGTAEGYVEVKTNLTFDLAYPVLFVNAAQTAGKTNGDNWYSNYSGVNLATTWAGWAGDTTTRGRAVYLVGTVDVANNTFTIDASCPFSLAPTPPCIPLGNYNANANSSFTFLPKPLIEEEKTPTIAMFVIPVNHETGGSFTGFELKATTNNFSHLTTEDVRLQYYAQSEVADTGRETPYVIDRMRMYTGTWYGTEDVRAYTPIPNTLDWTHKLMSVVVLVDASCLERHPDGGWLNSENRELIWCYTRNSNFSYEKEPGTDASLWRPIAPVRWYRELPEWARYEGEQGQ